MEEALEYAQTHLAERGEENPEILTELERVLALLAFEEPEISPFGELLHPSQRQKVWPSLYLVEANGRSIWTLLAILSLSCNHHFNTTLLPFICRQSGM